MVCSLLEAKRRAWIFKQVDRIQPVIVDDESYSTVQYTFPHGVNDPHT